MATESSLSCSSILNQQHTLPFSYNLGKMSIFNTIAFTKLNGIIAHDVADKDVGSDMIVTTFAHGLKNLGYLLSEDAYKHLCNLGDEKASRCLDILQIAKRMLVLM